MAKIRLDEYKEMKNLETVKIEAAVALEEKKREVAVAKAKQEEAKARQEEAKARQEEAKAKQQSTAHAIADREEAQARMEEAKVQELLQLLVKLQNSSEDGQKGAL